MASIGGFPGQGPHPENLSTMSSERLLGRYTSEVARARVGRPGRKHMTNRAALHSEILRRLRLVEPKRFA